MRAIGSAVMQATPLHQIFTGRWLFVVLATHSGVCRTHMSNPNLHPSETCFVTATCDYRESVTLVVTI